MIIHSLYKLVIVLMVALPIAAQAQVVVAPWPAGKKAALAITFDDNCSGQFTHARPALDAKGYKATFFVITGGSQCGLRNWDTLRSVAAAGHEIGSHSVTHPQLQTLDTVSIRQQLKGSYDELQTQIPALPRRITLAWPFGRGGGSTRKEDTIRSIARPYYFASRNAGSGTGWESYNAYKNPFFKDYNLQIGTYLQSATVTGTAFGQTVRACINAGGLMTLLYHGIETGGFNNLPVSLFQEHLDTLANHPDLWVTTFGNLVKYHTQVRNSAVNVTSSTANSYSFTLRDTLDATTFDNLLTIKFSPQSAGLISSQVMVELDGIAEPFTQQANSDTIIFNAKRGQQIVVSNTSGLSGRWNPNWIVSPNPATTTLLVRALGGVTIPQGRVLLIDQLGRIVAADVMHATETQIRIDLQGLPSGFYLLELQNQDGRFRTNVMVSQ